MSVEIVEKNLNSDIEALLSHPLYASLETVRDFSVFMHFHVYSVWDAFLNEMRP